MWVGFPKKPRCVQPVGRMHDSTRRAMFALPRAGRLRYSFLEGRLWMVQPFVCSATCPNHAALARSTAPFAKGSPISVFAPTASITAPIAGKPATLRWLRAVATELKNLHICIDADPRLAAAAGGVARFLADAAGLESEAVARLQSAVIEACLEAFEHLAGKHPHLEIDFSRFSDRLEVSLSHEDAGPAIGMHTITGFAANKLEHPEDSVTLAGVDRIQHETKGNEIVTRLTKYLRQVAPSL